MSITVKPPNGFVGLGITKEMIIGSVIVGGIGVATGGIAVAGSAISSLVLIMSTVYSNKLSKYSMEDQKQKEEKNELIRNEVRKHNQIVLDGKCTKNFVFLSVASIYISHALENKASESVAKIISVSGTAITLASSACAVFCATKLFYHWRTK